MLGALIIVFREVVEAGLVIGIVLAATRGIAGRAWWVCLGILAGVLGASIVAVFAGAISRCLCRLWPGAAQCERAHSSP